jgi:hypothetical protein
VLMLRFAAKFREPPSSQWEVAGSQTAARIQTTMRRNNITRY